MQGYLESRLGARIVHYVTAVGIASQLVAHSVVVLYQHNHV